MLYFPGFWRILHDFGPKFEDFENFHQTYFFRKTFSTKNFGRKKNSMIFSDNIDQKVLREQFLAPNYNLTKPGARQSEKNPPKSMILVQSHVFSQPASYIEYNVHIYRFLKILKILTILCSYISI